jgi:ferritin-like metal-binding protein YciE
MANAISVEDLFIEHLRRAYDAEKHGVKALPRVRDAATSKDLGHAGQAHYEATEFHVERLDQIIDSWPYRGRVSLSRRRSFRRRPAGDVRGVERHMVR